MSSSVTREPGRAWSVVSVIVLGAICELSDEEAYVPTFYYDSPKMIPQVVIPSVPKQTGAPDPNTELPFFRRGSYRRVGLPPQRWFRGSGVQTTLDQTPGFQRRWMEYRERRRKRVSLSFTEFADLSDGQRVIIRNDRGFGWSWRHSPDPWHGTTRDSLADDVRRYFVEIEEDRPCSPEWVVDFVAGLYDIEISPESVHAALQLPRQVELGPRLLQQLQH